MANDPKSEAQPEGAAKLVPADKVKAVEPEVDSSLMNRGAPGQASAKPADKTEAAAPDMSRLPKDDAGNPRDLTVPEAKALKEAVIDCLRTIYDPEIPVNVYELGLIYNVGVGMKGDVHVKMTLTSPACPVAGTLPGEVEHKIKQIQHVTSAKVELVWSPQWTKDMMSEAAKLELNVF